MKSYKLTKTLIKSGLQCHKKLWFDVHKKIKKEKATFKRGDLFGEHVVKKYKKGYGEFLDLTGERKDIVNKTKQAIISNHINVIFEGAFEYLNTQVRTDVLIRKKEGWELLEAKSSTRLKPEYNEDIAIQSFIVRECMKQYGQNLICMKLIHFDKYFTLKEKDNYEGLISDEKDLTRKIKEEERKIPKYIKDFMPLTNANSSCPKKEMGCHCKKPYKCDYQDRCKSLSPKSNITSYTILPYIGCSSELVNYMEKQGTTDLQKVPEKFFKPRKGYAPDYHKKIQDCHKKNESWINKVNLKNKFNSFKFPFYFMDFEFVGQGVPIIKGTQPYFRLPFQWSVHKWKLPNKKIVPSNEKFIKFDDQNIERQFVVELLKAVGKDGTIFAHHADAVEISILNELKKKDNCKDLADKIDNLTQRTEDTFKLVCENFYHPKMNGDYGIKSIIRAIPNIDISYGGEESLTGGEDAELAWFICTDPKTSIEEKKRRKKLLLNYCSNDTLAVYHLVKYLMENIKDKK